MTTEAVRVQAPARTDQRLRVPWLTVVPLAVVLAYGDGFWVVVLRGAVGAIERTGTPFTSWLRESTLLLPLFTLAVVAALALAVRRYGVAGSGARALLGTSGLVVAAGTVAGVTWLIASSAYDYRLQSQQVDAMGTMGHSCDAACRELLNQAGLGLQQRGVAVGVGLLLVTNLALVAWTVSLLGGRVRRATVDPEQPPAHARTTLPRRLAGTDWPVLQATALLGAAAVHAAVAPEHLTEWPAAGWFFVALALAEVALAALVLGRGARESTQLLVAAASVGPLLLWTWSRTSGMPFGPEAGVPEPVGLADCAAGVLELVALLGVAALLRSRPRGPVGRMSAHRRAVVLLAVVGVTCLGVGGSALPGVHQFGVDGSMTSAEP